MRRYKIGKNFIVPVKKTVLQEAHRLRAAADCAPCFTFPAGDTEHRQNVSITRGGIVRLNVVSSLLHNLNLKIHNFKYFSELEFGFSLESIKDLPCQGQHQHQEELPSFAQTPHPAHSYHRGQRRERWLESLVLPRQYKKCIT